jgi:hypothetical protein
LCDPEARSPAILHVRAFEQQAIGFAAVIALDLYSAGHRKVKRKTINNAPTPALRMTP